MQMGTNQFSPFGCAGATCQPQAITDSVMFLPWALWQFGPSSPHVPHLYLRAASELRVTLPCPLSCLSRSLALALVFDQGKYVFQLAASVSLAFPDLINLVKPFTFTCTHNFPLKGKNKSKMLAVLADELVARKAVTNGCVYWKAFMLWI